MTKLTKDQIAKELVKYDITLSPSQVKKTPIAELKQMLVDAINAAAAKAEVAQQPKIDLDQDPTPDEPRKPARATPVRQKLLDSLPTKEAENAAANVVSIDTAKKPRASKGVNLAPKPLGQQKACRANSKQAAIIDCLVDGATLWELTGATSRNASGGKDWSESSVRSALHWDVHSVKGYGVRTELMTPRQAYDAGHEASVEHWLGTEFEQEAIVPVYFLLLPAGMSKPLPHTPAREVKQAALRPVVGSFGNVQDG